jgi:hypothetical protein
MGRAMEIAGGAAALASRLGVEPRLMKLWGDGRYPIPERVFLILVDLVLEDDKIRAEQDRRKELRQRPQPDGEKSHAVFRL